MITFDGTITKFPNGESKVVVGLGYKITWVFEDNSEIFDIMLICDALNREGLRPYLYMPFIPYQQQDRVMEEGQPFSLKVFTELLKSCKLKFLHVCTPHSEVATTLLDGVAEHLMVWQQKVEEHVVVVVPDAGAYKRLSKLSNKLVVCNKTRDISTGNISGTRVDTQALEEYIDAGYTQFHVVDDICIRGGTFIPIAEVIRSHPKWDSSKHTLNLQVVHGVFPDGKEKLLYNFDEIIVEYDFYEMKKEKTQ